MIVFDNPLHGRAIAREANTVFNPEVDRCIARVEDGKLLGGVTYQGYTGASIHIHMAGFVPNWVSKDLLWVAFDYPFNQLGCRKVFGQVPETNTRALEIDQKLGFKIIAKIDDVFPDGACYVLALAREDCRWLKLKPRGLVAGSER
jgi:RimJ/RimL family protein N-acetyltransferase